MSGFLKGPIGKFKKMATISGSAEAESIPFTTEQMDMLAEKYEGREVSTDAQVAVQGTPINGIVIGRNDRGDYLIEVPTATRVKFALCLAN
jgi:hypothetical protein